MQRSLRSSITFEQVVHRLDTVGCHPKNKTPTLKFNWKVIFHFQRFIFKLVDLSIIFLSFLHKTNSFYLEAASQDPVLVTSSSNNNNNSKTTENDNKK